MNRLFAATLALVLTTAFALGCSSVGPRKYVLFGDPQPEKVEMFEDFWKDYPFKPDDPSLPLRRGKGGVIRFFKKDHYTRSIMVDGDLIVNVYHSTKEGVGLTQPDEQMVVTSKELNEKHRKFDKEVGYTYHVYLDLGEYEQPEEEITILSKFVDAKTGQITLSKEIRTTVMGTSPPIPRDEKAEENEAVRLARKKLGITDEDVDPIGALQAKYSARTRAKRQAEEELGNTRVRDEIDLSDSKFEDVAERRDLKSVSYLEEIERKQQKKYADLVEQNREKQEFYREKRRQNWEDYNRRRDARADSVSSNLKGTQTKADANSRASQANYLELQRETTRKYQEIANQFGERALEEYAKGPKNTLKSEKPIMLGYNQDAIEREKGDSSSKHDNPYAYPLDNGYEKARESQPRIRNDRATEMDALDDFDVGDGAPPTEVYVKKDGAR